MCASRVTSRAPVTAGTAATDAVGSDRWSGSETDAVTASPRDGTSDSEEGQCRPVFPLPHFLTLPPPGRDSHPQTGVGTGEHQVRTGERDENGVVQDPGNVNGHNSGVVPTTNGVGDGGGETDITHFPTLHHSWGGKKNGPLKAFPLPGVAPRGVDTDSAASSPASSTTASTSSSPAMSHHSRPRYVKRRAPPPPVARHPDQGHPGYNGVGAGTVMAQGPQGSPLMPQGVRDGERRRARSADTDLTDDSHTGRVVVVAANGAPPRQELGALNPHPHPHPQHSQQPYNHSRPARSVSRERQGVSRAGEAFTTAPALPPSKKPSGVVMRHLLTSSSWGRRGRPPPELTVDPHHHHHHHHQNHHPNGQAQAGDTSLTMISYRTRPAGYVEYPLRPTTPRTPTSPDPRSRSSSSSNLLKSRGLFSSLPSLLGGSRDALDKKALKKEKKREKEEKKKEKEERKRREKEEKKRRKQEKKLRTGGTLPKNWNYVTKPIEEVYKRGYVSSDVYAYVPKHRDNVYVGTYAKGSFNDVYNGGYVTSSGMRDVSQWVIHPDEPLSMKPSVPVDSNLHGSPRSTSSSRQCPSVSSGSSVGGFLLRRRPLYASAPDLLCGGDEGAGTTEPLPLQAHGDVGFDQPTSAACRESTPRVAVLHKTPEGYGFVLRGAKSHTHVGNLNFQPTPEFPALQYLDSVDHGSQAERAGLRNGDFILEINGECVTRASHERVVQLIRASGDVLTLKVVSVRTPGDQHPSVTDWFKHQDGSRTLPSRGKKQAPLPPRRDPHTALSYSKATSKSMSEGLEEIEQLDQTIAEFDSQSAGRRHSMHSLDTMLSHSSDHKVASVRAAHTMKRVSVIEVMVNAPPPPALAPPPPALAPPTANDPRSVAKMSPSELRIKKYHKKASTMERSKSTPDLADIEFGVDADTVERRQVAVGPAARVSQDRLSSTWSKSHSIYAPVLPTSAVIERAGFVSDVSSSADGDRPDVPIRAPMPKRRAPDPPAKGEVVRISTTPAAQNTIYANISEEIAASRRASQYESSFRPGISAQLTDDPTVMTQSLEQAKLQHRKSASVGSTDSNPHYSKPSLVSFAEDRVYETAQSFIKKHPNAMLLVTADIHDGTTAKDPARPPEDRKFYEPEPDYDADSGDEVLGSRVSGYASVSQSSVPDYDVATVSSSSSCTPREYGPYVAVSREDHKTGSLQSEIVSSAPPVAPKTGSPLSAHQKGSPLPTSKTGSLAPTPKSGSPVATPMTGSPVAPHKTGSPVPTPKTGSPQKSAASPSRSAGSPQLDRVKGVVPMATSGLSSASSSRRSSVLSTASSGHEVSLSLARDLHPGEGSLSGLPLTHHTPPPANPPPPPPPPPPPAYPAAPPAPPPPPPISTIPPPPPPPPPPPVPANPPPARLLSHQQSAGKSASAPTNASHTPPGAPAIPTSDIMAAVARRQARMEHDGPRLTERQSSAPAISPAQMNQEALRAAIANRQSRLERMGEAQVVEDIEARLNKNRKLQAAKYFSSDTLRNKAKKTEAEGQKAAPASNGKPDVVSASGPSGDKADTKAPATLPATKPSGAKPPVESKGNPVAVKAGTETVSKAPVVKVSNKPKEIMMHKAAPSKPQAPPPPTGSKSAGSSVSQKAASSTLPRVSAATDKPAASSNSQKPANTTPLPKPGTIKSNDFITMAEKARQEYLQKITTQPSGKAEDDQKTDKQTAAPSQPGKGDGSKPNLIHVQPAQEDGGSPVQVSIRDRISSFEKSQAPVTGGWKVKGVAVDGVTEDHTHTEPSLSNGTLRRPNGVHDSGAAAPPGMFVDGASNPQQTQIDIIPPPPSFAAEQSDSPVEGNVSAFSHDDAASFVSSVSSLSTLSSEHGDNGHPHKPAHHYDDIIVPPPPPPADFNDGNAVEHAYEEIPDNFIPPPMQFTTELHQHQANKTERPFLTKAVDQWQCNDVLDWLDSLDMGQYKPSFARNAVDGQRLQALERNDYIELGVTQVGHRMDLQRSIKRLLLRSHTS